MVLIDDNEFPLKFREELSVIHNNFITRDDNRKMWRVLFLRKMSFANILASGFITMVQHTRDVRGESIISFVYIELYV